ncbi:hypothetical protein K501DRAFT_274931 [Backusella circina FSU 941]|nr:hypothetical protein K501DRAFT_274931 [Backusella circina FSU 941]
MSDYLVLLKPSYDKVLVSKLQQQFNEEMPNGENVAGSSRPSTSAAILNQTSERHTFEHDGFHMDEDGEFIRALSSMPIPEPSICLFKVWYIASTEMNDNCKFANIQLLNSKIQHYKSTPTLERLPDIMTESYGKTNLVSENILANRRPTQESIKGY